MILYAVPVWVPSQSRGRERWLTRDELARLLRACWRAKIVRNSEVIFTRRHLALFILIGRYTGTRSAAICGATWSPEPGRGWMDIDAGVFHRAADGERTTTKRKPAISIPRPLLAHLRRWRRNNPNARFVIEWQGKPVLSLKRSWAGAREDAGLGPDVVPHTLRHTCATHLMQAGADKWEAAGFLGMSLRTLEETYGHHSPDHQGTVHRALLGAKRSGNRSGSPTLRLVKGS